MISGSLIELSEQSLSTNYYKVVLSHEFSHTQFNHVIKDHFVRVIYAFLVIIFIGLFSESVDSDESVLKQVCYMAGVIMSFFIGWFDVHSLKRAQELEADTQAALFLLSQGEDPVEELTALKDALPEIHSGNQFSRCQKMLITSCLSHPFMEERIANLEKVVERQRLLRP